MMELQDVFLVLRRLAAFCAERGAATWLVGGAVRDILMGRVPSDLDIATDTDGVILSRDFADRIGGAFVLLDDERGTGRVVCPAPSGTTQRLTVDLARLRGATLEADLALRDVTINALALPLPLPLNTCKPANMVQQLREYIIDPCNGQQDLERQTLRLCHPNSLHDDPLRLLRVVRLAAGLDMSIVPATDAAIRAASPHIGEVAGERVRDELLKLLSVAGAAPWLPYLDEVGLLTRLFPELENGRFCEQPVVHFLPVLAHQLETVVCLEWLIERSPRLALPVAVQACPDLERTLPYEERLIPHFAAPMRSGYPRAAFFKLAALLHDNAKPQTKKPEPEGKVSFHGHQQIGAKVVRDIARRLRLSREEREYITLIVRQHMRPFQLRSADDVTPRAFARFFRDTGEAGPDVLVHELADHLASRGPQIDPETWRAHIAWTATLLDTQWQKPPAPVPPLLNGHDLMTALGLAPGPLVGDILREIRDAQMAGEIASREEALGLARQLIANKNEIANENDANDAVTRS